MTLLLRDDLYCYMTGDVTSLEGLFRSIQQGNPIHFMEELCKYILEQPRVKKPEMSEFEVMEYLDDITQVIERWKLENNGHSFFEK